MSNVQGSPSSVGVVHVIRISWCGFIFNTNSNAKGAGAVITFFRLCVLNVANIAPFISYSN